MWAHNNSSNSNARNPRRVSSRVFPRVINPIVYQTSPDEHTNRILVPRKKRTLTVIRRTNLPSEPSTSSGIVATPKYETISFDRAVSPIRANPFSISTALTTGFFAKPKHCRYGSPHPAIFSNMEDNYNLEYLVDIIINSRVKEQELILPHDFLSKFNHTPGDRMKLVNYMFNVQYILLMGTREYYTAVILFDQILSKIAIPRSMYQLVCAVCLWIANKFVAGNTFTISDVMTVTGSNYTEDQARHLEIKILKLMDFQIPLVDMCLFLNTYSYMLNIERRSPVFWSIYFVSDCAVHLKEYSTLPCSLFAIASILMALVLFHKELVDYVKNYFSQILTEQERIQCNMCQVLIGNQIRRLKSDRIAPIIMNKYGRCDWIRHKMYRMDN